MNERKDGFTNSMDEIRVRDKHLSPYERFYNHKATSSHNYTKNH